MTISFCALDCNSHLLQYWTSVGRSLSFMMLMRVWRLPNGQRNPWAQKVGNPSPLPPLLPSLTPSPLPSSPSPPSLPLSLDPSLPPPDLILLYGCSLEAYTALHSLLVNGVAPELIIFAQPHPPTCFNNPTVEQRVQRSLEETGIVLLLGHTLSSVQEGGASLLKGEESVFIECQVHTHRVC